MLTTKHTSPSRIVRDIKMDDKGAIGKGKYKCNMCEYRSDRQYNVIRHEGRIHSPKMKRDCCGKLFYTKGEWYLHCEEFHPSLRSTSLISRKKYKILKHSNKPGAAALGDKKKIGRRRSARIRESTKKARSLTLIQLASTIEGLDMEDIPLIYFIQHRELRQKFIEESIQMSNEKNCPPLSADSGSGDIYDQCSEKSSSLTSTEDENDVTEQIFYHHEILSIATETVQYTECSNGVNIHNDHKKKIASNNHQSMANCIQTASKKSTTLSGSLESPFSLPLKKRILQELRIDSIGISHNRRLGTKSRGEHENYYWHDKENFKPISNSFAINVSKKVTVTRAEESVTWNEITQHQRAYLSSVDWDRYKIF